MSSLAHWENIIKEKRMKTPFRKYLMEITSWFNVMFYRNNDIICRYPKSERVQNIFPSHEFFRKYGTTPEYSEYNFSHSFFENYQAFFQKYPQPARLDYGANPNCDFSDTIFGAKNAYLSICI